MTTYKIRYKHYLVNLYIPEQQSGKSVLLLPGLPVSTNAQALIQTLLDAGAVVYYPYFSGTFDSGGSFGAARSIKDVSDLHPLLKKPVVTELYFGKELKLGMPKEIILAGMSYGAFVALLGNNKLYQKILLLSPALLFDPSEIGGNEGIAFHDQMKSLLNLLRKAHSYTYRIGFFSDLKNVLLGKKVKRQDVVKAFNQISSRTLVLHGTRDASVPVSLTKSIEDTVSNKCISWNYVDAGHSVSSYGEDALSCISCFIKN